VVDEARNTVYVSTGNNYAIPKDPVYAACIAGGGCRAACLPANDRTLRAGSFDGGMHAELQSEIFSYVAVCGQLHFVFVFENTPASLNC
jgi:hypothetical protein